MLAMLTDHTIAPPPPLSDDDEAKQAREDFLLNQLFFDHTPACSNVVIGLVNTAVNTNSMMVCPSPSQGHIHGASGIVSNLAQPPVMTYELASGFLGSDNKQRRELQLCRLHQATLGSVAYTSSSGH